MVYRKKKTTSGTRTTGNPRMGSVGEVSPRRPPKPTRGTRTASQTKAGASWKQRAARAKTPERKQEILRKRAAAVGSVGKKAIATAKAIKAKGTSATAAEQKKLADIQARRKAARSGRKKTKR